MGKTLPEARMRTAVEVRHVCIQPNQPKSENPIMRSFKTTLLAGASALLAVAALSAPASAQTVTVTGGGSSLIAPYITQAMGCYVDTAYSIPPVATDHVTLNTLNAAASPPMTPIGNTSCNGLGSGADTFNDVSSSSGNGLLAAYSHDVSVLGIAPHDSTNAPVPFDVAASYGLSDAALLQSDVDVWNLGTNHTFPVGHVPASTPASFQGKTFQTGGDYAVPASRTDMGALIQIPVSIDPVAFGYNPEFATGQAFQIHTGDGKIHLDRAAYCGIFNGDITDWNDSRLSTLNSTDASPHSLTGNVTATIHLIGRSDGSGTTFILQRHLAHVCPTGGSPVLHNAYVDGNNTLPVDPTTHNLPTGAHFDLQAGSGGVATSLNGTVGGIAYIGPDYLLPAVTNTHADAFSLDAATVVNAHDTVAYTPDSTSALAAFGTTLLPPQSDVNGNYDSSTPTSTNDRTNPLLWVPGTDNSTIEDPATGYPIVGTTNIVLSQHYDTGHFLALAGQTNNHDAYDGFLTNYYDSTNTTPCTLLSAAGLACLPGPWKTAITEAFITGQDGLGLQFITP
jgi:ABC-type phosphate transport system substrate-binding protein